MEISKKDKGTADATKNKDRYLLQGTIRSL